MTYFDYTILIMADLFMHHRPDNHRDKEKQRMPFRRHKLNALLFVFSISVAPSCSNKLSTPLLPDRADLISTITFEQPQTFRFNDVSHPDVATAHKNVTPNMQYAQEHGYGFDFGTRPSMAGSPYYFSVKVPPGNYRVTLELGHPTLPTSTTVKAESRRLHVEKATTDPGEFIQRDFVVNMRDGSLIPPPEYAPGGDHVALKKYEQHELHWDEKLTLEINGERPQVRSVTLQAVDVPTVYLVGDSTVTDQPYEPAASWGQMFPAFFSHSVAIANHAESGETLKSFISGLRLAKVLETMEEGDYLIMQFGHNDQKSQWPQTYTAARTTYKAYLRVFIAEARLRGATPILVTSMQRRTFDESGKIVNSHSNYPRAVRELALESNVPLIDLDAKSAILYEALGVENAPLAFNDNGKDKTHHNNYGAFQLAKAVVQEIRDKDLPLAKHLKPHLPDYDPAQPDPPHAFTLSPSPRTSLRRPDGD